jgi:hypothetical protein
VTGSSIVSGQKMTTQMVRGMIVDKESQAPLIGANVSIEKTFPLLGTGTDENGQFIIEEVPIGRQTIIATYLGYEPIVLSNILITSGKEVVLNFELIESTFQLDELVVKASDQKNTPMNEMALISARTFSIEETSRYASSLFDPARMAQNYAGLSGTGGSSDLFNEIIVRGNSPKNVLWRMEGIEIPNPNHFSELGNSGGGISMLSSSMLSNSDFYTGAFPAEFGNASSSVFDLNLRKGNNQKREYALMVGLLGIEAAAEGPIGKSGASYLGNVRYSTLAVLEQIGLNPVGDVLPKYGDISFNIAVPKTALGQFNLFGLGGKNKAYERAERDSTLWIYNSDKYSYDEEQTVGTIGLMHKVLFGNNAYLKTVIAASSELYNEREYYFDALNEYQEIDDFTSRFKTNTYRISTNYTQKVNARNTFKVGFIAGHMEYELGARERDNQNHVWLNYLENKGKTQLFQGFGQWKLRPNENLTLTGGVHMTYYELNNQFSIEPRLAARYALSEKHTLSMALGIHSKPEHPAFHLSETSVVNETRHLPNKDLKYAQSLHAVLGYAFQISPKLKTQFEVYYQHQYNVPVENDVTSKGTLLNALEIWDVLDSGPAINKGLGRNYGIDITVEKYFSQNYYFLLTGSVFESKFRALNGHWYNTRFNGKYHLNMLAGKEFILGRNKHKIFGFNIKGIVNGGNRETPIDLERSALENRTIRNQIQYLAESVGTYYRFDIGISYKINRPKVTHSILLDVQNVTNHLNIFSTYYNSAAGQVNSDYHTGLFPVLNCRIEF